MTAQLPTIIDRSRIVRDVRVPIVPALIAAGGERASLRFLEFFAAAIRNPHTRRAYSQAVMGFMDCCKGNGVTSITAVRPLHVAAWLTSIVFCAANDARPLLIVAAAFFPVGIVHGIGVWFGGW
jgi:hypothetical protein